MKCDYCKKEFYPANKGLIILDKSKFLPGFVYRNCFCSKECGERYNEEIKRKVRHSG